MYGRTSSPLHGQSYSKISGFRRGVVEVFWDVMRHSVVVKLSGLIDAWRQHRCGVPKRRGNLQTASATAWPLKLADMVSRNVGDLRCVSSQDIEDIKATAAENSFAYSTLCRHQQSSRQRNRRSADTELRTRSKNERTTALPTYRISLYSFLLYSFSSSVLPSSSFHPLGIDLSPRIHLYLDSSFSSLLSTRVQSDENKNQPTNTKGMKCKRKSSQCDKYLPNIRARRCFLRSLTGV